MSERERAKDLAAGKWKSILPMLGVPANYLDGKHHRCPANGEGEDRFRFADRNGSGSFFCRCSEGAKGGVALVMCCKGIGYAEACREVEKIAGRAIESPPAIPVDGRQRVARILGKTRPVEPGDEVCKYLAGRGLALPPSGLATATLDYFEKGERGPQGSYSTMVAVLRGHDGKAQTLHITYLQSGGKAPVRAPRKLVSGGFEQGSAIRLFPVAEHLGVAEGIETALSAAKLFDLPTWALVNDRNLRRFRAPEGVKRVSVFGDKDDNYAGQAAAYGLANDLERAGIACDVFLPTQTGKCDFNDVLMNQRVGA